MAYKLPVTDSKLVEERIRRVEAIIADKPVEVLPEPQVEEPTKETSIKTKCLECGDPIGSDDPLTRTDIQYFCSNKCEYTYQDRTNMGRWPDETVGRWDSDFEKRKSDYQAQMMKKMEAQTEARKKVHEDRTRAARESGTY